MKIKLRLTKLVVDYQSRLLRFLRRSQLQILILLFVALGFLYVRQTAYFQSFAITVRTVTFLIWLLAILLMDIPSRYSFLLALLTFWVCLGMEKLGVNFWSLRLITYTYYFLVAGVIQYLWETFRIRSQSSHGQEE